ncbi:MAG: enoyl-CoA hydratase-related protein [Cellvibrionales bacterium]
MIEEIGLPVISAIQGASAGGGMDLMCATDMRFCSADVFSRSERLNSASPPMSGHCSDYSR